MFAPRATTPRLDSGPAKTDRRTLAFGLLGSLLCYLAHPPFGLSLLAWMAPVPWLLLARLPQLPGRRPYSVLWLAGMAFWLAAIQWIRLPYWANIFGLVLLAAYLGTYLPAFVGLTRVAVHRLRVPLWLAAPIAWTGLEWVRARFLTGFLMASLAHTQIRFPAVIQIADTLGEYGVTFLIMLVAASIAEALPLPFFFDDLLTGEPGRPGSTELAEVRPRRAIANALIPAVAAFTATLGYGLWRLNSYSPSDVADSKPRPNPTIAIIQSDMLADWKGNDQRDADVMKQMFDLSKEAVAKSERPVNLVVWPETMYRDPLPMLDPKNGPPAEMFDANQIDATRRALAGKAAELNAAILVGIDRVSIVATKRGDETPDGYRIEGYNSSVLVDRYGTIVGTYDKMHLLPFGEFIPFVQWLPFLRGYSPITGLALPGALPEPMFLGDVQFSVNICYETVLPQLVRQQFVHAVSRTSSAPDVMVNLTNDAWYWGSSELDMHLASGVFRAVEMRTPLVVSANRGLSAYVDYLGRVRQVSERDEPAYLIAQVELPPRRGVYPSLFARYGDWFALICLFTSSGVAAVGWRTRRLERVAKLEGRDGDFCALPASC
jgi:apolipoprotein N-acyltransferase